MTDNDEGRPGEDQGAPDPQEPTTPQPYTLGWIGHERRKSEAERHLDRLIGERMPKPSGDRDEAHLDALESHLKATGEFYDQGSVWEESLRGQDGPVKPLPAPHLPPPKYDGPHGEKSRRGAHRSPRSWWRFW